MENQGLIWSVEVMKKLPFVAIMILITIIAAIMIKLLTSGISLRVATLIKPSEFVSTKQVAQAAVVRLYPDLQTKKWMIYQAQRETSATNELLQNILDEIKKTPVADFELKPNLEDCGKHCAFLINDAQSNDLYIQKFVRKNESSYEPEHFRLVVYQFDRTEPFIQDCESMQRLDDKCIRSISIRDAQRKMKELTKKYFFLKKYNHTDFFLFLEN